MYVVCVCAVARGGDVIDGGCGTSTCYVLVRPSLLAPKQWCGRKYCASPHQNNPQDWMKTKSVQLCKRFLTRKKVKNKNKIESCEKEAATNKYSL